MLVLVVVVVAVVVIIIVYIKYLRLYGIRSLLSIHFYGNNFQLGPGQFQNVESRNSQNRWYHENRGVFLCRMVVSRGQGLVSLTVS